MQQHVGEGSATPCTHQLEMPCCLWILIEMLLTCRNVVIQNVWTFYKDVVKLEPAKAELIAGIYPLGP